MSMICPIHCISPHVASLLCCALQQVDLVQLSNFGQLTGADVEEDPLISLSCGHAFTRSTLDGFLELHTFYEVAKGGERRSVSRSKEGVLLLVC